MATLRIAFLSALVLELLATISVALVAVSIGLRLVDGEIGLRTALLVLILAPEAYLPDAAGRRAVPRQRRRARRPLVRRSRSSSTIATRGHAPSLPRTSS